MLSGFFRIIKFSFQEMVRNMSLSIMTVLILILMLLSINTLMVVKVLTDESVTAVKKQIDVSIYFNPEATPTEIQEIRDYVSAFPEVEQETFFTSDEVFANFKKNYNDNADVLSSLDEISQNPLGPTLIIKTRDPKDYSKIITALSVPEYENIIEAKTFGDTQVAIDRIHVITTNVQKFTYFLTILFAVIAFIIIFNTIRVAIYTQRTEIGIKRLVGATSWFIRGPYLVESLLFSIISVGLTYLLVDFFLKFLDPYMSVIFEKNNLLSNYLSQNLVSIIGIEFAVVFLLTIISSGLAMRRYLRT
ncbi:MAG: permease-like cell division protein FtsX [Candidatus Magasanikbacteria bacterium]